MAKKKTNYPYDTTKYEGVWRTIGGRKVYIKKGQKLSNAMQESGKFKKWSEVSREEYHKTNSELEVMYKQKDVLSNNDYKKSDKLHEKYKTAKKHNEELERLYKYPDEYTGDLSGLEGKHIAKEDKFYTRKDGTKEYDPYKGTRFEKKYDSMDDVIKDPNSALNKYISEKENNGFTQQTDMYGGTREYSNEDLKRMEKAGVKPLEHSYTGGGWEGTKYNSSLSTKEIAKNISDYSKENFPDVKLSRKTDYNGIDIHIMSSAKDLYASEIDIDRMSDTQVSDTIRDSIGGYTRMDDWLNRNNRKSANGTFTVKDEKDYLKEELNTYKNRYENNVSGNEWYLSDYGKKVVSGLNKEMNSYNYDDSDGMVDYFDTNFYGYVHIGRWDRPYEVSNNESDFKKLYQQYLKEHKGSNMSLEDFKKWYK